MSEAAPEKYRVTDPEVAASSVNQSEPATKGILPLEYVNSDSEQSVSDKDRTLAAKSTEKSKRPDNFRRTTTRSTAFSATTDFDNEDDDPVTKRKPWYRKGFNPLRWGSLPPIAKERSTSREYDASFLSRLTFQWMSPLMAIGYKRPLELNDIWLVNPDRSAEAMVSRLDSSFRKRVARGDAYPLVWAIHETFKFEFWVGGACQFVAAILGVMTPFILRFLIAFAGQAYAAEHNPRGPRGPPIGRGIGLVVGITVMQMIQSLGTNHSIYRGMIIGGQSRSVLIAVIFEKAMRLSGRAKAGGRAIDDSRAGSEKAGEPMGTSNKGLGISGDGVGWGNGRVVNLMSTDTYRVDQASGMFHLIWTAPFAMIITLVVLVINLTYSALAGFALLLIGTPVLTRAIRILFLRRRVINKITDQRVSLTQEILQAVRFVKYFGWESSFLARLSDIRKREIHAIQVLLSIRNAINAISMSLPIFASMLAFITYALTSHTLDPALIFSSLALFNSLRLPLNMLPLVIGQVIDGWASMGRIQEFLLAEEITDDFEWNKEGKDAVVARSADFTWERTATQDPDRLPAASSKPTKAEKKQAKAEKAEAVKSRNPSETSAEVTSADSASKLATTEPFKLAGMDFAIGRHELVAIIGGVGSGKSSLLAALAGDMRKTSGDVIMGASRAFCPQYAWIQNATVKENILFGKDHDEAWYSKVIEACALGPDIEMLPNGDQTEIGERGITVSGGQKQRLNIARAIYFDADIVLMDDPLSAVDAHVGQHIFDHAITGLLQNKCRILATHQLHVLNRCDRIIWMDQGRIVAFDTYDNLMAHHEGFAKMMVTTVQEQHSESSDETASSEDEELKREKSKLGRRKKKTSKATQGLMQVEERAVRSVPWSVYSAYISASGTILNGPLIILLLIISQAANIATSLWISYWTSDKFHFSMGQYIGIYAGLGAAQAIMMFVFSVSLTIFGTNASKVMLNRAMERALRAPMSFFDTTPLGRITNRFSKDIDTMDNNLTDAMRMYFFTMAQIISVFILIIVFFHYFAIALGPLFVMFLFSASYYRASAREMKRHESVLRSNVFSRFGEALSGTACIRAYGLEQRFIKALRDSIDDMDSAYYLTFANQRWLSVRLDCIGNLLVFTTSILVITSRFNVSPSTSGLVLSYILSIVQMIQFTVRQLAEVENAMNATERLHYYGTSLEEEAPLHLGDVRPTWPEKGEMVFDNVQMRYRAGLPLVLQGLNMHVQGGERIGVVGRTGAGKSSIMSTLFRLVELSGGSITIDGVDISKIGLQELRSRLAIIPQDPTLFRGTIRSNLDPFSEHTDLELWSALRQSDLVSAEASLDDKAPGRMHLDAVVEEEGLNFSLGQRQLMALARALVRGSQIIVCDEATSSVDIETDRKIQQSIIAGFKGKTLLCIAHRLRTIINYDRICVMDAGKIAELDTPIALYDKESGIFRSMCERSGIRRADFLENNEAVA